MGWFSNITHAVANTATDAVNTVAHTTTDAANAVAHTATDVANTVAHTTTGAANTVANTTVSAWEATSDEAKAVGQGIESQGYVIGKGFVEGANFVTSITKKGVEYTGKGLVAAGDYVSQHTCDIALGSALSALFVATAVDGEEEVAMAGFASVCATQLAENLVINTAAKAVAAAFGEGIWAIPGVSKSVPSKDMLISILTFVLVTLAKTNPKMVVGTGGQIIAGTIISITTSLVCEGTIPGGFKAWEGAQKSL